MNEQEQALQELEIHGFTILESVVDADTAEAMRETLIRCAEEHGTEHTHRGSARGPPQRTWRGSVAQSTFPHSFAPQKMRRIMRLRLPPQQQQQRNHAPTAAAVTMTVAAAAAAPAAAATTTTITPASPN